MADRADSRDLGSSGLPASWEARAADDCIVWSLTAEAGVVQGPLDLSFVAGRTLHLVLDVVRMQEAGLLSDDVGAPPAWYLRDPDDNGVELYRDRSPADWPRDATGALAMVTLPLDLAELLADADAG